MSKNVLKNTLQELEKINSNLNLIDELQTEIHPEVFFRRNSVNLLIGKKGSGKTYNVFRELIKLRYIPKEQHRYTKLIYVSDKAYDPTYDRLKHLIPLTVEKVSYANAVEKIKEIAEAKNAVHDIINENISLDELTSESKKRVSDILGEDLGETTYHTVILLDDCQNLFDRKTRNNEALFKMLFENRQPKLTYFLTMQDPKHLDSSLKQNLDSCWLFGGFTEHKFKYLLNDIPHEEEPFTVWNTYRRLSKNQAIIFFITPTGTQGAVLEN